MIHAKAYPALNGHVSRHVEPHVEPAREPARGLHNGGQRADAIAGRPDSQGGDLMQVRRCAQCDSRIELVAESRECPICGLDPDLPAVDFDDAPAFFFSREHELAPIPIRSGTALSPLQRR
jgi:hypothetical protein